MLENDVKVTVICMAYNHERYIRKALDGFVMQKTNFRFEVIVHDDASTDKTADIIREYGMKYPGLIVPIYEKTNQYSLGAPVNKIIITPLIHGKYIAYCEGDDFWTDETKLQRQFNVMERNPDCSLCVHRASIVNEQGDSTGKFIPLETLPKSKMEGEEVMNLIAYGPMPFQTATFFYRVNDRNSLVLNPPEFRKKSDVGDLPTLLFLLSKGNVYYINESLSCYRTMSVGSWTYGRKKASYKERLPHFDKMIEMFESFDEFMSGDYHDAIIRCKKNYEWQSLSARCFDGYEKQAARLMLDKKYTSNFKLLSKKEQIRARLTSRFPLLVKLAMNIIHKIRNA